MSRAKKKDYLFFCRINIAVSPVFLQIACSKNKKKKRKLVAVADAIAQTKKNFSFFVKEDCFQNDKHKKYVRQKSSQKCIGTDNRSSWGMKNFFFLPIRRISIENILADETLVHRGS